MQILGDLRTQLGILVVGLALALGACEPHDDAAPDQSPEDPTPPALESE